MLEGSVAMIPTCLPRCAISTARRPASVLLPAPAGPVTPIIWALPAREKRTARSRYAAVLTILYAGDKPGCAFLVPAQDVINDAHACLFKEIEAI